MLGHSSFANHDEQPLDRLPGYITTRLEGMAFSVLAVELRPSRSTGGVVVNITLRKPANLNALFVAEQYLAQSVAEASAQKRAVFYWRYRPQAKEVAA